jgi:hypothetical protein
MRQVIRFGTAASFLQTVMCIDIADPVFYASWVAEVPVVDRLSPSELWHAFFNVGLPVKTPLPALLEIQKLWTDDNLISKFGNERVRTEPDRENRTVDYCGLERLGETVECDRSDYEYTKQLSLYYSLGEVIGNYSKNPENFNRYVISMLPDSMAKDMPFLPGFSCGLRRQLFPLDKPESALQMTQVSELNFWFSKGTTFSAIHNDMNHQIMCQITGRKEWRFWDLRTEVEHIPMWSGFYPDTFSSDDSPIDPLDVDLSKYPDFVNAKWMNTTLNPGECILIPSRHSLHFVRGFPNERNIGFSVHVSTDYDPNSFYDCDDLVANITESRLGDFDVMWPFPGDPRESGFNTVRMGKGDWKGIALSALRRISKGLSLSDAVSELTDGKSNRSKRMQSMIADAPTDDISEFLNFGPLWREIYTMIH